MKKKKTKKKTTCIIDRMKLEITSAYGVMPTGQALEHKKQWVSSPHIIIFSKILLINQ